MLFFRYSFEKVLAKIQKYNAQGIACSLSYLPVKKEDPKKIQKDIAAYHKAFVEITRRKLDCDVTIKLHQFGCYKNYSFMQSMVQFVLKDAKQHGVFVWIDQELPETVDMALQIYQENNPKDVGICLQAYLQRSKNDAQKLLKKSTRVRIVKGFYNRYDISSWEQVTQQHRTIARLLVTKGENCAIATHDEKTIQEIKKLAKNKKSFEFQFFAGVRDDLAAQLAQEGYRVRIYVPFGPVFRFLITGIHTFDNKRHLQRLLHKKVIV